MTTTIEKRPVGKPPRFSREEMRQVAKLKAEGWSYMKLARHYKTGTSCLRTAVRTIANEEKGHEA